MQTIFKHRIIKNIRRQYHISEIRIQATIAARHLTTTNIQNSTGHAPRIQNVNKELCVIRDCATGYLNTPIRTGGGAYAPPLSSILLNSRT